MGKLIERNQKAEFCIQLSDPLYKFIRKFTFYLKNIRKKCRPLLCIKIQCLFLAGSSASEMTPHRDSSILRTFDAKFALKKTTYYCIIIGNGQTYEHIQSFIYQLKIHVLLIPSSSCPMSTAGDLFRWKYH